MRDFALSVRGMAQDALWSSAYSRLYFVVVFENYVQLVWLALGSFWEKNSTLYVLEVVSAGLLICESILKAIAQGGSRYISQPLNVIDVIVIGLSVPVLIAAPLISRAMGIQSPLDVVCVCIRLCMQQVRLLCVLKKFVFVYTPVMRCDIVVHPCVCVSSCHPVNIPTSMPSLLSPSMQELMTVPSSPSTILILNVLPRHFQSVLGSFVPLCCHLHLH